MQYKIGICDDEPLQVKVNGLYVKEIAKRNKYNIDMKGFTSIPQLLTYLEKDELDVLFLDIDMGQDSGIITAQKLSTLYPNLIIVFVTGHREFANEAFDVEAMGYVVKPVEEHRLERVFKKAMLQAGALKNQKPDSTLIITEDNIKKKINQSDIIYIERQKSKSIIYTKTKEYQVYETITSLFERLDRIFLRVNQGEIVNMQDIKELKDNTVFLKNGLQMSIGRTFKKNVMDTYLSFPSV